LPFSFTFHAEAPDFHRYDLAVLVSFPSGQDFLRDIPKTIPVIACGSADSIAEAFRQGATDYLCEPWTEKELAARVGRLLPKTVLAFPGVGIILRGTRLDGPKQSLHLSRDEAALLRILYREVGEKVSRIALRRILWPRAPKDSRIVDETVSRLRKHLAAAGISKLHMEIRSIRGFGYRLEVSQ